MKLDKTDSWIVLSPSRSGSHVIIEYIKQSYHQTLRKELHSIRYTPKENQLIEPGLIWHAGEITSINFSRPETKIVVSTRNLIDCIVSHYVMDVFKLQPHFRANYPTDIDKLKSFVSAEFKDIDIVKGHIEYHCRSKIQFMNKVSAFKDNPRFTFIDYSDFIKDYNILSSALNVPRVNNFKPRLIKMPDYRLIIRNYDELENQIRQCFDKNLNT